MTPTQRNLSVALIFATLIVGGCTVNHDHPVVDLEALKNEVLAADVAFDLAAGDKDIERFTNLVAADALFLGSDIAEGREAVVASWSPLFAADATTSLRWKPRRVEVAGSGDLGYTIGDYTLTTTQEDGTAVVATGMYLTTWRRDADGVWRAAADCGTPPEPQTVPTS